MDADHSTTTVFSCVQLPQPVSQWFQVEKVLPPAQGRVRLVQAETRVLDPRTSEPKVLLEDRRAGRGGDPQLEGSGRGTPEPTLSRSEST